MRESTAETEQEQELISGEAICATVSCSEKWDEENS